MSEKVWFVVENKHQVGPFSRSQIIDMINSGELDGNGLVRPSGAQMKVSVANTEEFSHLFSMPELPFTDNDSLDLPPPLPPLPFDTAVALPEFPDMPQTPEFEQIQELEVEIEKEIELESALEDEDVYEDVDEEFEEDLEDDFESAPDQDEDYSEHHDTTAPNLQLLDLDGEKIPLQDHVEKSRLSDVKSMATNPVFVLVCATITVGVLLYSFYVAQNFKSQSVVPKNITVAKLKKMQTIAVAVTGDREMYMALTRDKNAIWLATNIMNAQNFTATFKSVDKQILGPSVVEFTSKASGMGAYAEFKKLNFTKGTEIIPGEYDAVVTVETGSFFEKLQNFGKDSAPIVKKLRVLLHPKENEDFLRDLQNYRDRIKEKELRPFKERLEKYRTLLSMIQRTDKSYFAFLEKALNGQSIEEFEKEYITSISPLFQNIVLETNRKLLEYERVSHGDAQYFKQIIEDYRAYGEMVSDMVTMTGNKKWLRKKAKRELEETFRTRVNELIQKTQVQIQNLESQINQF
ncbi:PF14237 domain protein [Bacteriovorax sp. BSW11_IV]|uniref:DUF4339 domain-containing protein n=1 Tax=Bacteriovorax sp. BSW11_IV TaxID=1353529 RepID=UPI000389DACB|nr:DUF4339 domain-containing protein [Bacteriovorax sp. BSW11_IV]EQC50308.1 PF14237 domain protein [Bacteriovorax sp. BSW11_IV]